MAHQAQDLVAEQNSRDRFEKTAGEILKEGYVYFGAKKEIILGDIDLALASGTQEACWAKKAVRDYSRANEVLGFSGDYWKNLLKDKIHLARSFK